jgi:exopolyphosphatase/guanosine-5'-triphosphate,3'-diphosphate pyrophosphatase
VSAPPRRQEPVRPRRARGDHAGGGDGAPRDDEQALRIAAIDIGSNSIRQIVADVSPSGAIRVIDEMKAMPRLGVGIDRLGALSDASVRAAISALNRMATLARQLGAERVEAVATSAVRDASNGGLFLDRVREETGLRVRILSGEEEARLSFRSALAHFELGAGRTVVMDMGGGSLELALAADGLLDRLVSLPFGAIRATEQFLGSQVRPRDVRLLRQAVREALRDEVPTREWRGAQFIGSGGTFTNLAAIVAARHGMPSGRSRHGTVVARVEVEHVVDLLQTMTTAERAAVPGLNPARADIIVAALAVAAEVLARFDARQITVSGYGIREGLLLEAASVVPTIADPGEARERSVREFAERCNYEEPHARHVQRLALGLYDAVGARLGCEPADRQILADAALLHDVGYHINYEKHHRHSYHLIVHAELLGMSPVEQVAVANIARYHRGAPPKKKHENFGSLDAALRRRITRLAALLRVADGFDRGHVGAVESIEARVTSGAIRLRAVPNPRASNLRLELWGASRKSALLAEVAGVPVEILAPDGSVVADADL